MPVLESNLVICKLPIPSPNSETIPACHLSNETIPSIISPWTGPELKTENGDSRFDPVQSLLDRPELLNGRSSRFDFGPIPLCPGLTG